MSYSTTDINVTLSVAVMDAKFWCGQVYEQCIGGENSRGCHEASQRLRLQSGSSLDFHLRLAHLSYDIIERMAGDPESEIRLTNEERPTCETCPHGKQRRNTQPQMDRGLNAFIDRIDGVICSELKRPITPTDRLGNRYMINFIEHKIIIVACSSPIQRTGGEAV